MFVNTTNPTMNYEKKCPYCKYTWQARKKDVKACPRCKRRIDWPRR